MAWVRQLTAQLPGIAAAHRVWAGQWVDGSAVQLPAATAGVSARRLVGSSGSAVIEALGENLHANLGWVRGQLAIRGTGIDRRLNFADAHSQAQATIPAYNFYSTPINYGLGAGVVHQSFLNHNSDWNNTLAFHGAGAGSVGLEEWMPAPAATGITAVNNVTVNSATVHAGVPANTGRPTTQRVWQLATGAASTAVTHTVTTGAVGHATFTGLAPNTRYRARVINRNATGDSPASAWWDFYTLPAAPAQTGVTVDQIGWDRARIVAGLPPATGAALSRRWQVQVSPAPADGSMVFDQSTGAVTTVDVTGLAGNTGYAARVVNWNSTGNEGWGPWHHFTTAPAERAWVGGVEIGRAWIGGVEMESWFKDGARIWNRKP